MNRLERVSSWLKKEGHDAAFIHTKENVFYLTDFYTDPHERLMGLFLFQEQEPFSFVREWKPDKPAAPGGSMILSATAITKIRGS